MTIHINNMAQPIDKKGKDQYYRWEVFVDEPEEKLDQIKSVEYVLHPTFPEPYQIRDDKSTKFSLRTAGWGEFGIAATVHFKNGGQEKVKYHLDLSKPWQPTDGIGIPR